MRVGLSAGRVNIIFTILYKYKRSFVVTEGRDFYIALPSIDNKIVITNENKSEFMLLICSKIVGNQTILKRIL